MFFDHLEQKKHVRLAVLPPVPETGWRPPADYPNLDAAEVLSIDTETRERDFDTGGPGWARGSGHIVGFSVAAKARDGTRGAWYFPVRHEVEPEDNLPAEHAFAWLKHSMAGKPIVGANLSYDLGWLSTEGIEATGPLFDVQFAEALIDEEGYTNLDYLAAKYLGKSKVSDAMYEWLAKAYGGEPTGKQRQNIWRAPPRLVGAYGEADAALPLDVLEAQTPILDREGTWDLFRLECRLLPLLQAMRWAGVTVDLDAAERAYAGLSKAIGAAEETMRSNCGFSVNVNSPDDMRRLFDYHGLDYPRTPLGKPSFRKEWLEAQEHGVGKEVNEIRKLYKVRDTFIRNYVLRGNVNGKIHAMFNSMRGDDGGTKTGRFSSSYPNLQNIPVRTPEGKLVRKAFVPDAGHIGWRKYDYSQIEYRMLAHFAVNEEGGTSADALRATYQANPKADYHNVVQDLVKEKAGIEIDRKPIKNINFGLLYGQTQKALAYKAGFTDEQARDIFKAYHEGAPYCRATMEAIQAEVQSFGYVRTILNRRTRFNLWEPAGYGEKAAPMPRQQAIHLYGINIKRGYAYKGVNYKLQGSAADVCKQAMVKAWESGVFSVIGVPRLQVHDELDFSQIDDSPQTEEAFAFFQHTLENSTPCRVPIVADCGKGPNWGETE